MPNHFSQSTVVHRGTQDEIHTDGVSRSRLSTNQSIHRSVIWVEQDGPSNMKTQKHEIHRNCRKALNGGHTGHFSNMHIWCCRLAIHNIYITQSLLTSSIVGKWTFFVLWSWTLTDDLDFGTWRRVKLNHHAKYLHVVQRSFRSKVITHTHSGPIAGPGHWIDRKERDRQERENNTIACYSSRP